MVNNVLCRDRELFRCIYCVQWQVIAEIITGYLYPDFVTFLEGMEDRYQLNLIIVDFIWLRKSRFLEGMERRARTGF